MTKSDFTIRPATPADVDAWYGKPQRKSMRAITGEVEGEVVALGGVYREDGFAVGFVGVKPSVRHRVRDLVRMAKAGRKILQDHALVVAFADRNESTADGLLRYFGFEHQRPTEIGEMYLWTNRHKAV